MQIEQDFVVCARKFPTLLCRPVAAQFMPDGIVALFKFEKSEAGVRISSEKHYKLVPPEDVTAANLKSYQQRTAD